MAYVNTDQTGEPSLGCGPGCGCQRPPSRSLGQWYVKDEEPGVGLGAFAATVTAADPATGAACSAAERRITPIVEPPKSALVRVPAGLLSYPRRKVYLVAPALAAFQRMKTAAEASGLRRDRLTIVSGYRSIAKQRRLWANALRKYGSKKAARRWVAPPGGSSHHTGRTVDLWLGTKNSSSNIAALRATREYAWLVCNATRFGFTPYRHEPWHWEYNGPEFHPGAPPAPAPAVPAPEARTLPATPSAPSESDEKVVQAAIRRGERRVHRLTDRVFHHRHPGRRGRRIARGERDAAREWLRIRRTVVLPALRRAPAASRSTSTPPAMHGRPRPDTNGAPVSSGAGAPVGGGTLSVALPGGKPFTYRLTPDDVLWTARMIEGEAGGRDDRDNEAVIWAMLNRYAFHTHRNYPTFHQFIRAYSTPLQPVLKNWRAAKAHAGSPAFVKTGGTYTGKRVPAGIPKGQLDRHLALQARPWAKLRAGSRKVALRVLGGRSSNPIGNASEFASTRILFRRKHGRTPTVPEWEAYTRAFKNDRHFRWIGPTSGIDQMKNAFFVRTLRVVPRDRSSPRFSELPAAVRVLPP